MSATTSTDDLLNQTSATPVEARDEWAHVPTPGDHYSPRTGSAIITVIREMTRWHNAAGGRSRVLVARGTWDGYDDGARREVDFPRLGTPPRWQKAVDRTIGAALGRRLFSGRPYAAAARELGRAFDGVVFVHNEPSGVEEIARRCPNARVCLWVQNELFRTYTRAQARRVVEHAHRVICCSDYIRRQVVAKTGDNARLVTVLNGVDTERFRPAERATPNVPPVVLFVGRMVPEKGVDVLIRAALELKHRGVPFQLRLVGSQGFNAADALTPFERTLRDLATGLGDSVEFQPFRPRAEIVGVYQAADVFCVPSNWDDPCPLTVLEGMACGLAIVASRRGGIPEEAGPAALYFDPPDHLSLAERIAEVLANVAGRDATDSPGQRSRLIARGLAWKNQCAALREELA